ncbi:MAG: glycerol kinase GlpK [Clostridia bacterium]|nr:glycerol kinase GlpK [Clostridia bacterium]
MAILALDQGTTSSRAILFDRSFRPLGQKNVPLTQHYPKEGWVEHDAEEIFRSQMEAAALLLADKSEKIDCIGITNQRETTILWNAETGKPVAPAIVWQCRRTAPECEELIGEGLESTVKATTGLPIDAYFSATKIAWLLSHSPEARSLADEGKLRFGTVECWLVWKLTGNHLTDVTNASRTMLMNLTTMEWDPDLCRRLGIPMSILPKIVDNAGLFGIVREGFDIPPAMWGKPVTASAGDQQAALFGQTCFALGDTKNTYGTGCFALMNIGSRPIFDEKLITTVGWKIGNDVTYALEGSVFNAGSAIQWLRDELKLISSAPECDVLAGQVEDSGGVIFVPAFTGLGAPHWDMYARGALLGLTRGSNRSHICRAVLEGIAYQSAELIFAMQKASGIPIRSLKVDGGASVSVPMMQFQADLLNITVDRPAVIESTALGAAMLAGIGAGLYTMAELSKVRISDRNFDPQPETAALEGYARWQAAVRAVQAFE